MKSDEIWAKIKAAAFANKDPEWRATFVDPVSARISEHALVLYAHNQFVAEMLASVRSEVRAQLPSPLSEVHIRTGLPSEGASAPTSAAAPSAASPRNKSVSKARPKPAVSENMLPIVWPRDQRGMPADLLRSNLFTVNRYGLNAKRPFRNNEQLQTASSYMLRVKGEETNIFDSDVFAQLLHYQRNQEFGTLLWFSLRELCIDLDLPTNGSNIEKVKKSLERLHTTRIMLTFYGESGRSFDAYLISSFSRVENGTNDQWCVELGKQLVAMLGPGIQTRYPLEMDRGLGSSLARYLLRFYSSHSAVIYPMRIETLRKYCGTTQVLREFRRTLVLALQSLVDAGFLDSFLIEDDKVSITKKPVTKAIGNESSKKD